jgi:hypothetical protein
VSKPNRIGVGLLSLILCGWAHGQSTAYSSGSPNLSTIWYGDISNAPATQAASEFTLAGSATLNQLSWWGGYNQLGAASAGDSFQMNIYSASGGTVGSLVASVNLGNAGGASTARSIVTTPEYAYNASFASSALGSGTYFLGLQRSGASGMWGWETSNATAQSLMAYQDSAGAWFYNSGVSLAFSLGGTLLPVPEASTALMWMVGWTFIGLLAWRRADDV